MTTSPAPLLDLASIDRLRDSLQEHFTVAAVNETLDWQGQAALQRGDLAGVARALDDSASATLIRAFMLAEPVEEVRLTAALGARTLGELAAANLVALSGEEGVSRIGIRPYAEADAWCQQPGPWWIVSDFGSEVVTTTLAADHVLGVGSAARLLTQSTIRRPVARALDIGTGCGIQSLHLAQHAEKVVSTDISSRALRFAATTAALAEISLDLREGSLLEPVVGERFDLVVCNPPFVISPGWSEAGGGFTYRDGGRPADELCAQLVAGLGDLLTDGGTAQLLANWAITSSADGAQRVESWLPAGVDAWVWQREVADPGEYISLWLRDGGEVPGTASWRRRYDDWCDWFERSGILAVGMGLISLRRRDGARPVVSFDDVVQPVDQPIGPEIAGWFDRAQWLAQTSDAQLLRTCLHVEPSVQLQRSLTPSGAAGGGDAGTGWRSLELTLTQISGMRWQLETDELIAGVVAACDGSTSLILIAELLADAHGAAVDTVAESLAPVIRDLVGRGFLSPFPLLAPRA